MSKDRKGSTILRAGAAIDPDEIAEQHLKMVLCGSQRCGKTKLYDRIVKDTYSENYFMTIGSDYSTTVRVIPGAKVNLEVWDTGGSPEYRNVLPMFFHDVDIVFVVYDISNERSFEAVPGFVTDARNWADGPCDVGIIGTKIDSWRSPRKVSFEEGNSTAAKFGARYFETSAVTTQGLEGALRKMIKKALKRKGLLPDWLISSAREDSSQDEDAVVPEVADDGSDGWTL